MKVLTMIEHWITYSKANSRWTEALRSSVFEMVNWRNRQSIPWRQQTRQCDEVDLRSSFSKHQAQLFRCK